MESYTYEDLPDPNKYIRILRLAPGLFDDPLRGSLETSGIYPHPPRYEALSYLWGSSEKVASISLDSNSRLFELRITHSLSTALRRMRHASKERVMWADAICINQENVKEKSVQVRHMTGIYWMAVRVLIYLGEQNETGQQATQLLDQLHRAVDTTPPDDSRTPVQWISDNKLPPVSEPSLWEPLKRFFCLPYFRRMWIIQEIVVSRAATMFYGDWACDWAIFEAVQGTFGKYGLAVVDYTTFDDPAALMRGLGQMSWIKNIKNRWQRDRSQLQLMDLLYRFQSAEAWDTRDCIFALRGLAADVDDRRLDPDYSDENSPEKNAERYARYFLEQKSNLEVLCRAESREDGPKSPSWVPYWYGSYTGLDIDYSPGPWDPLRRPKFFNVTPNTDVQLVGDASPGLITLQGIQFDEIASIAFYSKRNLVGRGVSLSDLTSETQSHLRGADKIMREIQQYPTGERPADVQWRTLFCNVTYDLEPAPDVAAEGYQALRRRYSVDGTLASPQDWQRNSVTRVFQVYNAAKTFGATRKGYVGMFPRVTRVGDRVVAFFGGPMPFILRPSAEGGTFKLVGQCYVHGIMQGVPGLDSYKVENWTLS